MARDIATGSYGALSVGTTASQILAPNQRRRAVTIVNTHATQTMHIGFDPSVTTTTGYKLTANATAGSTITIEDYGGPIYAIASGAATTGNYLEIA